MILDINPGQVIVHLTLHATRVLAADLEGEGEHTVAAEGLRRATNQAERGSRT